MTTRKGLSIASAFFLVSLVLIIILIQWRRESGHSKKTPRLMRYENARKLLDNYIIALHEHNCMGIRALVPGDYEAQADIDDRLEKFGGVRIDTTKIDISSDINPDILSAYINSSSDGGQVVKWTENLVWRDGQWWLVLGSLRPGDLRSRINR